MAAYRTEAFVLRNSNFGEADRLLTIFTKHLGKKKVIAKGVRRITSRRGGNLELFNKVVLFLHEGKTFDIVTEAEVINSFPNLRKDLPCLSLAFVAAEVIDRLTPDGQEHRDVFDLLDDFYQSISCSSGSREVRLFALEVKVLKALGFWNVGRLESIPKELRADLHLLETRRFDELTLESLTPKVSLEIGKFLSYYIENVAESRLRSEQFRKQVGQLWSKPV